MKPIYILALAATLSGCNAFGAPAVHMTHPQTHEEAVCRPSPASWIMGLPGAKMSRNACYRALLQAGYVRFEPKPY